MILVIIMAILGYQKAKASGRNGILWAVAMTGIFIGTQIVVGLGCGVLIGVGIALWDWPETAFDDYIWPINILATVASFLVWWPVLRYIGRPLVSEMHVNEPPPPPQFG